MESPPLHKIRREEPLEVTVVRRFTSTLEPSSNLNIETKRYQEKIDTENEIREKNRMDSIYYGPSQLQEYESHPYLIIYIPDARLLNPRTFRGAEVARNVLQSKCDEFFTSQAKGTERKRSSSFFQRLDKGSGEYRLRKEIDENGLYTVEDVKRIVKCAEDKWEQFNGTVGRQPDPTITGKLC